MGDHQIRWLQYLLLAQLGQWEEIAPAAESLFESLQTPEAARISALMSEKLCPISAKCHVPGAMCAPKDRCHVR